VVVPVERIIDLEARLRREGRLPPLDQAATGPETSVPLVANTSEQRKVAPDATSAGEANNAEAQADSVPAASAPVTVYVTDSGSKYHSAGCRYLAKSSIPISLSSALGQYGPCSVCHPPSGSSTRSALASSDTSSRGRSINDPDPQSRPSTSASPGTTATGIPLHVGPRGGIYHYSKSGKKVYQRKK
jgi:hypothetical protein